jgi:tRNA U34 5-methylaminomethyl-2-thiouridine-forming methyltransferase MnmC
MKPELRLTADGSNTFFISELDEHYHSVHGARQESEHVFIAAGLNNRTEDVLSILEIGFGTGLNALLTALEVQKSRRTVYYTGLEKYPLHHALIAQLNYVEQSENALASKVFSEIHNASWEALMPITAGFNLKKSTQDCVDFFAVDEFHLIYYDAFAPSAQPELWTTQVFKQMYTALKPGGTLVTYCAKGQVKRNMKEAGFLIEALPGPPGKREMTRARKD